ncbi:hypothetical protein [Nonomuraea salmonea]|uniref:hypothetical protein n=1 Tax=Nonomuraea salmonea TaxID=46181 RepID=UPI0031EBCAE4
MASLAVSFFFLVEVFVFGLEAVFFVVFLVVFVVFVVFFWVFAFGFLTLGVLVWGFLTLGVLTFGDLATGLVGFFAPALAVCFLVVDLFFVDRIPLAVRGRQGAHRVGCHRPRRHPDHRALEQGGRLGHFQEGLRFHPLAGWCANTHESLAMLLRIGSGGSNTITDHVRALSEAIRQIPEGFRARIWIRIDDAGATHDLVEHMKGLNTTRRTVRFTVGWEITDVDEAAMARLPADAWQPAVRRDGTVHPHAEVAELTGLDERAATWGDPVAGLPCQALGPRRPPAHRSGETDRLEVRDHRHQPRAARYPGQPSRPVHRCRPSRPRRG